MRKHVFICLCDYVQAESLNRLIVQSSVRVARKVAPSRVTLFTC